MIVLVCGSRDWNDEFKIWKELHELGENCHVIHGGCGGADSIAGDQAVSLRMKVTSFPAEWKLYGRSAGPIRNRKMLDMKPDLVLAFHSNIEKSKGTKDCVIEAQRRGIYVKFII